MKIPACAANHRHPLVRAVINAAQVIYEDRGQLGTPGRDRHGNVTRPAMPQLLMRRRAKEGLEALDRRRADGLQAMLSVLLVQLAYTDYRTKAILEPDHELAKRDPYLSLRRLAVEAELIGPEYKPGDPGDRVERVLQWERRVKLINFTHQHRERKPDGQCRSARAALRRLNFKELYMFGGEVARQARRAHQWAMERSKRSDERFAAAVAEMNKADPQRIDRSLEDLAPATAPAPRPPGQPDPVVADMVAEAHPDWDIKAINDEARRMERAAGDTS